MEGDREHQHGTPLQAHEIISILSCPITLHIKQNRGLQTLCTIRLPKTQGLADKYRSKTDDVKGGLVIEVVEDYGFPSIGSVTMPNLSIPALLILAMTWMTEP